ncbi:MAG: VTT domain-containing protein [Oscillospiraceae bacterium]|nr:VTT domain-containing protein [Oscillospiraceae bacterium]
MINNKNKNKYVFVIGFILIIITSIFLLYKYIPIIQKIDYNDLFKNFSEYIKSKGIFGTLIFILIIIVQVVISIIPGEPIEILAGVIYGSIYGYLICSIGITIGTIIVYNLVKHFGHNILKKIYNHPKFLKLKFLKKQKSVTTIVFLLFLIPGTPKDTLIYFIPILPIPPIKFFIISYIARIPSILSSTFAGSTLVGGNPSIAIFIFLFIGISSLIGIMSYETIVKKIKDRK